MSTSGPRHSVLATLIRSRWTFEILLAAVLLTLALVRVDLRGVGTSFANAQYGWALLAAAIYALTRVVHAIHWQLYLKKVGRVPLSGMIGTFLIGNLVDNVLPVRIGEIARMQIVANRYGLSRTGIVAGRATEVLVDGIAMAVLFLIAVALLPSAVPSAGLLWIVAGASACVFAALALLSRVLPDELAEWPPLGLLPARVRQAAVTGWPGFRDGLEALRNTRLLAVVLGLTAIGYTTEIVMFWTFGLAFHLGLPLSSYVSVVVAVGVVRTVPITFQNIGTYEVVLVAVLSRQGAASDAAFAYAVATRVFVSLFITTMGLLAMWTMRVRPHDLFALRRTASEPKSQT
jgi:hypothetical protein